MKDFFTRYREFHKNPIVFPALFGLILSFAIVANMQGTPLNLKSISANVVAGIEQKPTYPAELMMKRDGNALHFTLGKDAESVRSIYFTLLWNPVAFEKLETTDTNTSISMNEPGVAFIRINVGKAMSAWSHVTTVTPTLKSETPLTVVDAGFSSETGEYSLSVMGE